MANNHYKQQHVNDAKENEDRFSFLQSPKPFSNRSTQQAFDDFMGPADNQVDSFSKFFEQPLMSQRQRMLGGDRFGSMDRMSNRRHSKEKNGNGDVNSGPMTSPRNDGRSFSSLDRRQFPSDQHLPSVNRDSFFSDMDDIGREFFERNRIDADFPRMAEWGFTAPDTNSRFADTFEPRSSSSSNQTTAPPTQLRERVVAIKIDGQKKPTPPARPVGLESQNCTQNHGNFGHTTPPQSRQIPVQVHSSAFKTPAQVHKAPDLPNIPTQTLEKDGANAFIPLPEVVSLPKFEPDEFIKRLSQAPLLSGRLAGKLTRFDEFSDVLSRLPKQPEWFHQNQPSNQTVQLNETPLALPLNGTTIPTTAENKDFSVNLSDKCQLSSNSEATEQPTSVVLFDEAVHDVLRSFIAAADKIGSDVKEITDLTKEALDALRLFLWNAAGIAKPSDTIIADQLRPISAKIEAIQGLKTAKRSSPFFNHLSAIAEGIPAIGWITISPTPGPYVKEMSDASKFYVNRVLKDFKEKDATHAEWLNAWLGLLSAMQAYVKQNHTTGLVWNSSPGAKAAGTQSAKKPQAPDAPKGTPAPPPPPPPAYLLLSGSKESTNNDADSRAALFADISKGLDITKSLKKVTDDLKTHKNRELRQCAVVIPDSKSSKPALPAKPGTTTTKSKVYPPKIELEGGKKWVVEYVQNNNNVVINVTDMKQVVYIYKCSNAVIKIKGKLNSITMDGCEKTSLVFDDLVSSADIINCQRAQVQSLGKMPTLAIQKTDGCQIYLSANSLNAEIVTSKSSEMNILVPNTNGEYDEFPVPEQYKTVWNGKKLDTHVADIA